MPDIPWAEYPSLYSTELLSGVGGNAFFQRSFYQARGEPNILLALMGFRRHRGDSIDTQRAHGETPECLNSIIIWGA